MVVDSDTLSRLRKFEAQSHKATEFCLVVWGCAALLNLFLDILYPTPFAPRRHWLTVGNAVLVIALLDGIIIGTFVLAFRVAALLRPLRHEKLAVADSLRAMTSEPVGQAKTRFISRTIFLAASLAGCGAIIFLQPFGPLLGRQASFSFFVPPALACVGALAEIYLFLAIRRFRRTSSLAWPLAGDRLSPTMLRVLVLARWTFLPAIVYWLASK